MYFERPLLHACNALTDSVLSTLRRLAPGERYYRGDTDDPPDREAKWSLLLEGQANGEQSAIDGVLSAMAID